MYRLFNLTTGKSFELDELRFVYMKNGVWLKCEEPDAQCVAINGERFSIAGRPPVEDAPEVVAWQKINPDKRLNETYNKTNNHEVDISGLQEAYIALVNDLLDLYRR